MQQVTPFLISSKQGHEMAEKKIDRLKDGVNACFSVLFMVNFLAAQTQSRIASSRFFAAATIRIDKAGEAPVEIRFPGGMGAPVSSFFEDYKYAFGLSSDNHMTAFKIFSDRLGQTHHRYKHYYKGV